MYIAKRQLVSQITVSLKYLGTLYAMVPCLGTIQLRSAVNSIVASKFSGLFFVEIE